MFRDLARLFANPARIKILKYFVLQPDAKASAKPLATTIGVSIHSTEEELRALQRAGILGSRKQGKTTYYTLSRINGLNDSLRTFLDETTLPSDSRMIEILRSIRGLTLVVATGMLAKEPRSSVDLLIVTKRPKDERIAKAVRKLEGLIALPVRYAVLESDDYGGRLESYDRLLRDVFEFEHRVIFGRK